MEVVIFDCDGVLVDSEILALQVLKRDLTPLLPGIDVAALVDNTAGLSTGAILARVEQRTGRTLPPGTLSTMIQAIDLALDEELQPIPGALEAITHISTRKAVASNSSPESVRRSLARAGLTAHFGEWVFSADMVANPKPAPDLYLYAAQRLGVAPAHCLVVEDSVSGVTAAHLAGMTVIGFAGASHVPADHQEQLRRAGATLVIDQMKDLPALINGWPQVTDKAEY